MVNKVTLPSPVRHRATVSRKLAISAASTKRSRSLSGLTAGRNQHRSAHSAGNNGVKINRTACILTSSSLKHH